MNLKRQFIIFSAIIVTLVLGIGFFIFAQMQGMKEEIEENRLSSEIMKGVSELDYLVSDYLRNPNERVQEQWQSKYQSIDEFLHSESFGGSKEKLIIYSLHGDHDDMKLSFSQLVENIKGRELGKTEGQYSQDMQERIVTELLLSSRAMVSKSSQILKLTREELSEHQDKTNTFVMIAIGILLAIISFVLLLLNRVILMPILKLREGAEIIGQGNLKHRIAVKYRNEIGALALSFNHMASQLRGYYAELENKVKERTKELERAKKSAVDKANRLEDTKTATLNILEDVKEAEKKIKESEIKFRTLFESAGDAIFTIKIEPKRGPYIIDANSRAVELFGYSREKMLKESPLSLSPLSQPDGKSSRGRIMQDAKAVLKGKKLVFEWVFVHADGSEFPAEVTLNRVEIGGEYFIQAFMRDITERKEIDKAKNEFVSLASHQLRTPLTGIKWLIQAVLKRGDLNKWQIDFLQDALKSNGRLILLVSDLLNISRLEAGVIGVSPKKTDLLEFINELVKDAKISAKDRGQMVQFKVSKPSKKITISLDQQLIGQVVTNLLSNAVKYGKTKKPILVSITKKKDYVEISVKDYGIGISKRDQKQLFTKFFRTEKATRVSTTGSGLGLYIIKKILDACAGSIQCHSDPGKGSTFTVILPIKGPVVKRGKKSLISHKIS